jgi:hypothetical protein
MHLAGQLTSQRRRGATRDDGAQECALHTVFFQFLTDVKKGLPLLVIPGVAQHIPAHLVVFSILFLSLGDSDQLGLEFHELRLEIEKILSVER